MSTTIHCVVIDDDGDWIVLAKRVLRHCPWEVQILGFTDGEAALAHLAREHSDLVITDLHMPCIDGFEVIERVRRMDARVPVVVMSSDLEAREAILAAGATAFVPKSALSLDLGRAIAAIVERRVGEVGHLR